MRDEMHLDAEAAFGMLKKLGAPSRLLMHGRLVLEAADALLECIDELPFEVDVAWVRAGAVLHDAGKSIHSNELSGGGCAHEAAGQKLLLSHGVPARVARVCVSHGAWDSDGLAIEELMVALADKLWKGRRVEALEKRFIDRAVAVSGLDRWSLWVKLDSVFEQIADGGFDRLSRS